MVGGLPEEKTEDSVPIYSGEIEKKGVGKKCNNYETESIWPGRYESKNISHNNDAN